MPMRRSGFTLIELLVVISIIALLIAILLPAMGEAREKARQVVCATQLRQVYIALDTYANDSNEYYMGVQSLGRDHSFINYAYSGHQWMADATSVYPDYIGDRSVLLCPSGERRDNNQWPKMHTASWTEWSASTCWTFYSFHAGFGRNHNVPTVGYDGQIGDANRFRGILYGQYTRRAEGFFYNYRRDNQRQPRNSYAAQRTDSIMVMDIQRPPRDVYTGTHGRKPFSNHKRTDGISARGANAAFKDGSVRWMNLSPLWYRSDLADFRYATSCYAEASLPQYVDEAVADIWR